MQTPDDLILSAAIRSYEPDLCQATHTHDTVSVTLVLRGMIREAAFRDDVTAESLSLVVKPEGVAHADLFGPDRVVTSQLVLRPEVHDHPRWRDALSRWRWIVAGPGVRAALALARVIRDPNCNALDRSDAVAALLDNLSVAPEPKSIPDWIPRAVSMLRDQIDAGAQQIRVADVAAVVGIHPVHVSRVFMQRFGCTVSTWVRRYRVQRAASYLSKTQEHLSGIAVRTGFADHSHMNRSFRRETAVLPGEFRNLVTAIQRG